MSRKKRRSHYQNGAAGDAEGDGGVAASAARASVAQGAAKEAAKMASDRSLSTQIASIRLPDAVNGRKKGFKNIRRQLMTAVKDVRRRYHDKARRAAARAIGGTHAKPPTTGRRSS